MAHLGREVGRQQQPRLALPPQPSHCELVADQVKQHLARDSLLGVTVRRMTLRCGHVAQNVAMDDQLLHAGWWAAETHDGAPSRWTDGNAALPFLAAGLLELELAGTMRYPAETSATGAWLERDERAA